MSAQLNYTPMDQTQTPSVVSSIEEAIRRPNRISRNVYSTYTPNNRFSRYNNTLRSLLPFRLLSTSDLSVENAGLFSFLTFHWIFRYLRNDPNYPVELPLCPKADSCQVNSPRLDGIFINEEINNGKLGMSMIRVVWTFVRTRTIFACFLYILASILSMGGLVNFLPGIGMETNTASRYLYLLGLVATELISYILFSLSKAINLRTAVRMRSACFSSLFRQVLLSSLTYKVSSWQLTSFLLSDGKHIHDLVIAIPNLLCTPFIIISCMAFAGVILDIWGYMSVIIILLFFPIFIMAALISKKLLHKASVFSDERVKLLEEFIINNIYVKFFKQEESFKTHIAAKRKKELDHKKRSGLFDNLCISFVQLQPLLSMTALFVAYYDNLSKKIDLSVFAAICIILMIHMKQLLDNFWHGLNSFIKGLAALNKFKTIMSFDTINSERKLKPNLNCIAIQMEDANFQWTKQETFGINCAHYVTYKNYNVHFKNNIAIHDVLTDINMHIEKGKLIGICGPPGSGKTSLLLAIMGLILKSKGERKTVGNFAYVSQDPVVIHETLKNNITFGQDLDSARYDRFEVLVTILHPDMILELVKLGAISVKMLKYYRAVQHCNLLDISIESQGADNLIDSKLLTMQQKQCIALARALYSNGDIYLLDNPFSALEYHRKLTIFDNCLRSLQDKTILLVTDQIEFLEQCSEVYMLQEGKILVQGNHEYLLKTEQDYLSFIQYLKRQMYSGRIKSKLFETEEEVPSTPNSATRKISLSKTVFGSKYSILSEKTTSENTDVVDGKEMKMSSIFVPFVSYFGILSLLIVLFGQIVNSSFTAFLPIYFIITVEYTAKSNLTYLGIYFGLFLTVFFIGVLMNFFYNKKMFAVSAAFHDEFLDKLHHATLSFFQSTTLGIISKLSLYLHLTDSCIPGLVHDLLLNIFLVFMTTFVILFVSVWYSIPTIFIFISMGLVTNFVSKALLNYNGFLLDCTDKLYIHVITMLKARPVFQAYDKTHDFINRLYTDYDEYLTYSYIFEAGKNWLCFVLQSLSVLFLAAIGLTIISVDPACVLLLYTKDSNMPCLALAVVCVLQVCFASQRSLVLYVDAQNAFDTLSRVQQLKMNITEELDESEAGESHEKVQEKVYSVEFHKVSLHTERSVLDNMTFRVKGNEKMGFIGLTSCEKKAIIALIYRLNNATTGTVMLGNENIIRYQLSDIRSHISIIPSEPYLFNITIRQMLNAADEIEIVKILQTFLLWDRVERLPKQTDSPVDQYFTSDEKQILCLAQACLNRSLILVIENVINGSTLEYILDTKLQKLFPESTVLVFANGVYGLKACDRITIVENGKVSQIGNTKQMLVNVGSRYTISKPVLSEIYETSF